MWKEEQYLTISSVKIIRANILANENKISLSRYYSDQQSFIQRESHNLLIWYNGNIVKMELIE